MRKRKIMQGLLAAAVVMAAAGNEADAAIQGTAEKTLEQAVDARPSADVRQKAQQLARSRVTVSKVEMAQGSALSQPELLRLVPELAKKTVDVQRLSRQLALYNENGALAIAVRFERADGERYRAIAAARQSKPDAAGIFFSNSGSVYNGDWRATATYVNRNLSGRGDTVGVALTGSPDHWRQLRQGAFSYRFLLPKAGDAMTVTASHSDSRLSNLAHGYPFDLASAGKSTRFGLSWQHYLANSQREQDWFDVGITHHRGRADTVLSLTGYHGIIGHYDVSHTDGVAAFCHRERGQRHIFHWRAAYQGNFDGDQTDFHAMTPGSAKHYHIWQGNVDYLYRFKPGNSWMLGLRAAGQYTNDALIGCEKFGAGGRDSVRGFDENIRTADRGVSGSVELYTPQLAPGLRLLAFVDGASLSDKQLPAADLVSGGLGVRYDRGQVHLALDYAGIMHEPDSVSSDPAGHRRWNVWGGVSF